jgi:hypothetical protein
MAGGSAPAAVVAVDVVAAEVGVAGADPADEPDLDDDPHPASASTSAASAPSAKSTAPGPEPRGLVCGLFTVLMITPRR